MLQLPDKGTRIRLLEMGQDPAPIEVGTEGEVVGGALFEDWMQIWVRWDNGRSLALCCPPDRYEVVEIGPRTSVQRQLAAITDLTFADCAKFFTDRASERDKQIVDMAEWEDLQFEVDYTIVSEGDDNGAYVMGWRWVDFAGTELDKDVEGDDEENEVIEEA